MRPLSIEKILHVANEGAKLESLFRETSKLLITKEALKC